MKIGILTFHEVFNPGAFFQALASQMLLESMGHDAFIIDYTPMAHRYSTMKKVKNLSWRAPFFLPSLIHQRQKHIAFAKQRREWMNLTPRFENREEVKNEEFDCVLIGADIVWNFDIETLGKDPVYFGEGLNTRKLVAFAPSFGPIPTGSAIPDYVSDGIKSFDHIAVRDAFAQGIVEQETGNAPEIICDPAFHLDLEKFPLADCETEPHLLIYMMPQFVSEQTIGEIKTFAKKNGLKTIATMYRQKWVDENRVNEGPIEWLRLFKSAKYVITNTFHGIVFASKMEKRFAMQYTPSIKSKSIATVQNLDIENRLAENGTSIEDVLSQNLGFDGTRARIEKLKLQARNFLESALA